MSYYDESQMQAIAAGLLSYQVPVTESKKTTRVVTKRIDNMTPEEVLKAYRQHVPQDWEPTPEQKQYDEMSSLSLEELQERANQQLKTEHEAQREKYRIQNAVTWQNTPGAARYAPSVKNAEALIAVLDEYNLEGSVSDMQAAFDHLSSQGRLELKPQGYEPKPVMPIEEFSQLSPEEMRLVIEQSQKDGII